MTLPSANAFDTICTVLVFPAAAYLLYLAYERSAARSALVWKWIITVPIVLLMLFIAHFKTSNPILHSARPVFTIAPAIVLGLLWAPSVSSMFAGFLTNAMDGSGDEESETKPFYFIAEGKRRKGLYVEAIDEVRNQLQKFPGDFEGYTRIASIQMENLKDLPAAKATLNEYLELPDRAPNQIVSALHLLADWQLQFGRDAGAASASLQRIIQLFPGTPFAHAAEQRIAHLGSADEASRVRHESKFTVPTGQRDIGLQKDSTPVSAPADPHTRAAEFVKQLESHPSDTEAREKLAVLYAEEFQRLDLAVDQLEQLIALPAEPPKHIAHWLNLLATLHVKYAYNLEAGERALRRITERFPGGALSDRATLRLATLNAELKASKSTPAKTLGAYEKNMGLKQSNS